MTSLLSDASNFGDRFISDFHVLRNRIQALKQLGLKIVLTSGSFDIIHEGHSMYLEAARQEGDFLVVGVDSDEKVRQRKGEHRPVVPEMERARMVTHQRGVGLVALKQPWHSKSQLIMTVLPDVLVVTADTYTPEELRALSIYYGRVEVLERMATVSTSARLREILQRSADHTGNL